MNSIGSKLFSLLVIVLLGTLVYVTVFSGNGQAPDIRIKTADNQSLNLSKPMKPVLVNFWATTCPGCVSEMPHLAEMKKKFGDKFELVAVSMDYDPEDQVKKFMEKHNYAFSYIMDKTGSMAKAFGGVMLTPTSFLIAPNGNIVYQKVGEIDYATVTKKLEEMTPDL
ncbi:TlpA family protein disulfide reductase [Hydrogenovibrio kuenenii]|uniref:TlpA family protein disulfide reductase n=1 Tax=Hydrogenovibrio kuenenii TaxID=63658 RepID=UPI000464112B|nr:TlpA disulfide reductase family protein [Hydrogenovibrio kuenenii]